jgi:hypothetical protein
LTSTPTTDEQIEESTLKKKKLMVKDEIYAMMHDYEISHRFVKRFGIDMAALIARLSFCAAGRNLRMQRSLRDTEKTST